MNRRRWVLNLGVAATVLAAGAAFAQPYPSMPVKLIVPFAPGGGVDATTRILGEQLEKILGQPVVVDNRPGAGGIIGSEQAARSPADGYTLLVGSVATISINPGLHKKLVYNPATDLVPVAPIGFVPNILVVTPGLPVANVKELIQYARSNPGQVTFGSGGVGTSNHLSGELFRIAAGGIDIRHVPYKVGAQATSDLAGGHLSMMFDNLPTSLPLLRTGKLKALAVTSARRSSAAPEIPTMAEAGVAGYEVVGWSGLLAPAGTPREIVATLNAAVVKALSSSVLVEKFRVVGAEPSVGTPEQFAAFIHGETERWGRIIREANVQP